MRLKKVQEAYESGLRRVPLELNKGRARHSRLGHRYLTALALVGALVLMSATGLYAQVNSARNFSIPDPYPPPHQDKLKTLTTGDVLEPQPDGTYHLKGVMIKTFRETGDTNLIMRAPSCTFDKRNQNANSPGPLQIDSGDNNLHIEGEGFAWLAAGTNTGLVISNKVHTIIRKDYLAQPSGTNAPAATNNATGTNQIINVFSDHFQYDRQTELITYRDHVQAEDSQIFLTCDIMTIQRTTNGAVETIVADGNVVIINKASGGHTTGDHAVYTTKSGKQDVVLTGNPHLLENGREGTGKAFIFDRLQNTLEIEGEAYLKLPRDSISQSGLLLGGSPAPTNAPGSNQLPAGGKTNGVEKFVEIYSDQMTFQMPPTNGPVQKVIAERNVVILDPERNSRATGGRAVFTDATGLLELSQDAMWQADQRVAKGGLLIFDRNTKGFTARTNAYLKLPVAAFGNAMQAANPASTNTSATNQFVGVLSDHYEYENDVLTFHDQAHAALLEGETVKGMIDCATLTATFTSNQLHSIRAEGDVYARMLPAPAADGRTVEKDLKCDFMTLTMRTNGLVEEIVANKKVFTTQTETRTNSPVPIRETLSSDVMTTTFQPGTNAVDRIVAERKVIITRDEMTGTGERAVYTAADDMARLTGNPLVTFTNGTLRGTVITLDRRNNKFLATKSKIVINVDANKFGPKTTVKKTGKKAAR